MITKEEFLFFYIMFLFIVMQLSAMAGSSIVRGMPDIQIPSPPSSIWGVPGWVINNIKFFFKLMTISTPYTFLGAILLTPFFVLLVWMLIEMLTNFIPK